MVSIRDKLFTYQNNLFTIFTIITWITYICLAFGIFTVSPQYLTTLDYYVKIYISLFLLYRFNPFRTIEFNELDKKIAFNAGIFLFTTTAINSFLIHYLKNIKDTISQKVQGI